MDDGIHLTKEHENCDCHEMLNKTDVCMPEKCHIIHEDTLDLFDYYKEKVKQYEKLKIWTGNRLQLIQRNDELEQKNKKLKEDLENTLNQLDMRNGSIDNLKEKLEKIKQLWKNKPSKWVESMYEILD